MTALILDAGPLLAVDRNDRSMMARLRAAQLRGLELRTHAFVVAQIWRDDRGRQANLARLLQAVDIVAVDDGLGRSCGVLLGRAKTSDPIDATVVLIAEAGDRILTSDAGDIEKLCNIAGRTARVVSIWKGAPSSSRPRKVRNAKSVGFSPS